MKKAEYFVVLHQGNWCIKFNGKHFGPLRTEREAAQVATAAAERAQEHDIPAAVFVQDVGGMFRQKWPAPRSAAASVRISEPG